MLTVCALAIPQTSKNRANAEQHRNARPCAANKFILFIGSSFFKLKTVASTAKTLDVCVPLCAPIPKSPPGLPQTCVGHVTKRQPHRKGKEKAGKKKNHFSHTCNNTRCYIVTSRIAYGVSLPQDYSFIPCHKTMKHCYKAGNSKKAKRQPKKAVVTWVARGYLRNAQLKL